MAISIDNYEDYEAVIVGRVAKMRDCTPTDLSEDSHLFEIVRRCWDAGIPYLTAAKAWCVVR